MKKNKNAAIDCFKKYMLSEQFIVLSDFKLNAYEQKLISEQKIYNHIKAIKEFHDIARKYSELSGPKLKSSAGKLIENYKINLKKTKKEFSKLQTQKDLNEFETYFLENADTMIKKAEKSIYEADNSKYLLLILRSMKRNEICLGNTSFDNLRKTDVLEIASFDDCRYDMVETDGIYFFKKIRKKIKNSDFEKMITDYCHIEELNSDSIHFMLAALSYPYDFMKISVRYMENKKDWDAESYSAKLKKAVKAGKQSFI